MEYRNVHQAEPPERTAVAGPGGSADTAVSGLGTILGIWAHPDDEAYLSAGLMAAARAEGQRVVVVTATAGEHGTDDAHRWPPDRLAPERRAELAQSLAAVGVEEHRFLGYPDGGCADVPVAEAIAQIADIFAEVRPDTVVTFGPDGMTGHPDHRTVSGWATQAWLETGGRARLWYATTTIGFHERWGALNERLGLWPDGQPPIAPADHLAMVLRCDGPLLGRKFAALRAHRTQTAGVLAEVGDDQYRQWWSEEAFADAARVIGAIPS